MQSAHLYSYIEYRMYTFVPVFVRLYAFRHVRENVVAPGSPFCNGVEDRAYICI